MPSGGSPPPTTFFPSAAAHPASSRAAAPSAARATAPPSSRTAAPAPMRAERGPVLPVPLHRHRLGEGRRLPSADPSADRGLTRRDVGRCAKRPTAAAFHLPAPPEPAGGPLPASPRPVQTPHLSSSGTTPRGRCAPAAPPGVHIGSSREFSAPPYGVHHHRLRVSVPVGPSPQVEQVWTSWSSEPPPYPSCPWISLRIDHASTSLFRRSSPIEQAGRRFSHACHSSI